MKKIIFLTLLLAATLWSCNDDDTDNNSPEGQDPVIGSWQLTSITSFEEDGTPTNTSLTECEKLSTLTFEANGTLTDQSFVVEEGDCVLAEILPQTWENEGGENYSFKHQNNTIRSVQATVDNTTLTLQFLDNTGNIESIETYTATEAPIAPENDPILGQWSLTSAEEDGTPISLTECAKLSSLTFKANGTLTDRGVNEDCSVPDPETTEWVNLQNGGYLFIKETNTTPVKVTIDEDILTLQFLDNAGNINSIETYTATEAPIAPENDLILGYWRLTNLEEDGSEISLTECKKLSSLTFKDDSTFTDQRVNENCSVSDPETSVWINLQNGGYLFIQETNTTPVKVTIDEDTLTLQFLDNAGNINSTETYTATEAPIAPENDPILGAWSLTEISIEEGEANNEALSDCEALSNLIFSADGTLTDHITVVDEGCTAPETLFQTWENRGNGTYLFINEVNIALIVKVTFEGNTLTLEIFDQDGNLEAKEIYTTFTPVIDNPDPILGKWTLTTEVEIDDNGQETEIPLDNCQKQSNFEFIAGVEEDNILDFESFEDNNGVCSSEGITSGTWKNQGNRIYIFDLENVTSVVKTTFEGNTLTIHSFDKGGKLATITTYTKAE